MCLYFIYSADKVSLRKSIMYKEFVPTLLMIRNAVIIAMQLFEGVSQCLQICILHSFNINLQGSRNWGPHLDLNH